MAKRTRVQMEMGIKEVGHYLRDLREEKGITQKQIAEKLGYTTPQFISNWERGLSMLPTSDLAKILKLYGADVDTVYNMTLEHQIKKIRTDVREKIYGKTNKS